MALGLLAIFVSGSAFLCWMIQEQESRSRTEQIMRELNSLQSNSLVYIRHLLVLDGQNNDESSYREVAQEMVQELYQVNGCYTAAYALNGELMYAVRGDLFDQAGAEDLKRAQSGTSAFTIFYPDKDRMAVSFSMPVVVIDETVGILRFWLDYTSLYNQGQDTVNMVLKSCLLVFFVIFAAAAALLSGILKPIRRLSRISRQVTEGLDEGRIDRSVLDTLQTEKGPDEVGRLAGDMESMLRLLDEQFADMKEDKAQILELLKSRQEFYNNMTHELKTPLTVIQGYSGLLESAGDDVELREKAVGHIRSESERLHRMVLQLLDLAKKTPAGPSEPVELSELADSVVSAMEMRAERYGIHIAVEMEPGLIVSGQRERLRQVFVNLLDNAIKYADEGSPVQIRGRHDGDEILIQVENTGFLSEENREKIFEPFYRVSKEASREMGSAGLGLPLCRQIMEEHGGRIEADCRERRVTFCLHFLAGRMQTDQGGDDL